MIGEGGVAERLLAACPEFVETHHAEVDEYRLAGQYYNAVGPLHRMGGEPANT